jgi:hypothetical protein
VVPTIGEKDLELSTRIVVVLSSQSQHKNGSTNKMSPTVGDKQCEVVLVGCGAPLRGMGWYHAEQLLKGLCPSAKLCYIVEPWFLGPGASGPGGPEFQEYRTKTEEAYGVQFHTSLADLPSNDKPRMALISGRTADNPRLLSEAIKVRRFAVPDREILDVPYLLIACLTRLAAFPSHPF